MIFLKIDDAIRFAKYAQEVQDGIPEVKEFYKLAEKALKAFVPRKSESEKIPLTVDQIKAAKKMPVLLKAKGIDDHVGFIERYDQKEDKVLFWWMYMDFAEEYPLQSYGKDWIAFPYFCKEKDVEGNSSPCSFCDENGFEPIEVMEHYYPGCIFKKIDSSPEVAPYVVVSLMIDPEGNWSILFEGEDDIVLNIDFCPCCGRCLTKKEKSGTSDIDFIKLPVPLSQEVYRIEKNPMFNSGVESAEIFLYGKVITPKYIINKVPFQISMLDEYGKTVFKDEVEANEKMEEMLRG